MTAWPSATTMLPDRPAPSSDSYRLISNTCDLIDIDLAFLLEPSADW